MLKPHICACVDGTTEPPAGISSSTDGTLSHTLTFPDGININYSQPLTGTVRYTPCSCWCLYPTWSTEHVFPLVLLSNLATPGILPWPPQAGCLRMVLLEAATEMILIPRIAIMGWGFNDLHITTATDDPQYKFYKFSRPKPCSPDSIHTSPKIFNVSIKTLK